MTVGEICTRDVVFVHSDESAMEAVKLMREHHVGDVVVVDGSDGDRTPTGVLTDRDIVIKLVAAELNPNSISCGDAMSYELVTLGENDDLFSAIERLRDRGVRRAPVVNSSGALVGILTMDDIIEAISDEMNALTRLVALEQRHEHKLRKRT